MQNDNPLLVPSELPPFLAVKPEHVLPALEEMLKLGRHAVAEILKNSEYDFESVVGVRDRAEDLLSKSWGLVSHLNSVTNSEALRKVYNAGLPELSEYGTEMAQNENLYAAYKAIDTGSLSAARRRVVENSILDFELSGVALQGPAKKRSGEIQKRLSELCSKFSDHVLDATMAWTLHLESAERLKGLPQSALALLAQNAQQRQLTGYVITLEFPSYMPVMTYGEDAALRREVYEAYSTRASELGPQAGKFDNTEILNEILALRQELAQILGFKNAAEKSLARKMAKSTDEVLGFLRDLAKRSRAKAEADVAELREFAKTICHIPHLEAWDVMFVSEKLKEKNYCFSQEETKPYFPIERVLQGMFDIASRLFGITITSIPKFETWHPDVRFYKITKDGEMIARFYLDPFSRQNKRGGAWMDDCRSRQRWEGGPLQTPVAYLVCNFTPPVGGHPSLLTHDEVTTLFHEFGHGLQHMLTQVEESAVSGINGVAWDAVELPSQFMENWCWQPEALPMISGHFESAEPLPKILLERMLAAKNFQSGMAMLRQIEFSLFDFRLHLEFGSASFKGVQALLDEVRQEVSVLLPPKFNRFQNGFTHIFAGGYAAGYYSYKWAEVLSADAFSRFETDGIFNAQTGAAFRNTILSQGGVRPAAEIFMDFMGREPNSDALLRHCGIA
jgi:oligopeptidase A